MAEVLGFEHGLVWAFVMIGEAVSYGWIGC
jgi:hypothetical protein